MKLSFNTVGIKEFGPFARISIKLSPSRKHTRAVRELKYMSSNFFDWQFHLFELQASKLPHVSQSIPTLLLTETLQYLMGQRGEFEMILKCTQLFLIVRKMWWAVVVKVHREPDVR